MRFKQDRFSNQHLACYLTHSTANQWASAASRDFFYHIWSFNVQPAQSTFRDYSFGYSDGGMNYQTTYRVFTVNAGSLNTPAFFDLPGNSFYIACAMSEVDRFACDRAETSATNIRVLIRPRQ